MANSAFPVANSVDRALRPPQGRLTLATGTPVMATEQAAKTTIYYTPYVGDRVPIYDGSLWEVKQFSELSIAMAGSANWPSGAQYDLFVYNDGGTLRLVTGTIWTNATTRAESLTLTNGIYLNTNSQTARYGASSTVTMPALRGTYVGTFAASANGTTTWELGGNAAGGDPGKLYLWNCYNRVDVGVIVLDSTASWTYTSGARAKNNSTDNRVTYVYGLNEDAISATCIGMWNQDTIGVNAWVDVGIDTTSAPGDGDVSGFATSYVVGFYNMVFATTSKYVGQGGHYIQAIEQSNALGTTTWLGDAGPANGLAFSGRF